MYPNWSAVADPHTAGIRILNNEPSDDTTKGRDMTGTEQYKELLDAIQIYFQGEKLEALIFILPVGLLSTVFGLWLFTDNPGSFARGVAIPFLIVGLLMTTMGSVVGFRTPSQVTSIIHSIELDSQAAIQAETQRMDKVNKAWPLYLAIWVVFGISGLVLRFAGTSDFLQGVGIALVFFAGVGLLIDGFAERRTHPYVDVLKSHTTTNSMFSQNTLTP